MEEDQTPVQMTEQDLARLKRLVGVRGGLKESEYERIARRYEKATARKRGIGLPASALQHAMLRLQDTQATQKDWLNDVGGVVFLMAKRQTRFRTSIERFVSDNLETALGLNSEEPRRTRRPVAPEVREARLAALAKARVARSAKIAAERGETAPEGETEPQPATAGAGNGRRGRRAAAAR